MVGRWAAFMAVILFAAWLPQVILFLGLIMDDPAPATYFVKHWLDIPKFLLAGLVMTAYATTLAMLTASFTTRRAYASVFLVGLFVILTPFTLGLSQELEGNVGRWLSMMNLGNIPVHVNDIIFGEVTELTEDARARELAEWVRVVWYLGWTLIPGAWLWWRYRRLQP